MTDRAVSTTLGYTLTLAISAILILGLLTAGGEFVDRQRDDVVDSELRVIGQRLAADIATTDRLARTTTTAPNATVSSRLPDSVSGSPYRIELRTTEGNVSLDLTATATDRSVIVSAANTTDVVPGTVRGGDLQIAYNRSADHLEVTDG